MYYMKFITMVNLLSVAFLFLSSITHDQLNQGLQTGLLVISIIAVLVHMIKKGEYKRLSIIEDPERTLKELKDSVEEVKKMSKQKWFQVMFDYLNPKLNKNSQLATVATVVLGLLIGHLLGFYSIPFLVGLPNLAYAIIAVACLLLGARVTLFGFETKNQFIGRVVENANDLYDQHNQKNKGG